MQVSDAAELETADRRICWRTKTAARNWAATRCKVVAENLGAVDRTVEMILEQLKARGIYIAPEK